MNSKDLTKPFTGLWKARAYVLVAAALWVLHAVLEKPFSDITVEREWWHDLVDNGVGSIDKFAYIIFLAGIVYAVVSDVLEYLWNNNMKQQVSSGFDGAARAIQAGMISFTNGLSSMTVESVKYWIESNKGSGQDIKDIAKRALHSCYGPHHKVGDSIIDHMIEDVLDRFGTPDGIVWENLTSNVIIRPCDLSGHFQWEEMKEYIVVCDAGSGTVPVQVEVSFQVRSESLLAALSVMEYRIRYGNEIVASFRDWWLSNSADFSGGTLDVREGPLHLVYDGLCLTLAISVDVPLSRQRTPVSIFERSYISTDDRCYSLAIRHPTKNLKLSVMLESLPRWSVGAPATSADLYARGLGAVRVERNYLQRCSADVEGWNMPGLAAMVEWFPNENS